jgi:hypothetical protein
VFEESRPERVGWPDSARPNFSTVLFKCYWFEFMIKDKYDRVPSNVLHRSLCKSFDVHVKFLSSFSRSGEFFVFLTPSLAFSLTRCTSFKSLFNCFTKNTEATLRSGSMYVSFFFSFVVFIFSPHHHSSSRCC